VLHRGSNCPLSRAMDGRIMRRGIISSCQSAATSEIVKRCCSSLCKQRYSKYSDLYLLPLWDQCKKTDNRPTTSHLGKFKWPYLRKESSDPLHVWFHGGVSGVGVSSGVISGLTKSKTAAHIQDGGSAAILENSYGDTCVADHPIYSVFGSRMGFLGLADRMALSPVLPHSIGMWEKTMHEE